LVEVSPDYQLPSILRANTLRCRLPLSSRLPVLVDGCVASVVEVRDSDGNRGSTVLDRGPRTIWPNSKSILELVRPSTFLHYSIPSNLISPLCLGWLFPLDTPPGLTLRSPLSPRASPAGQNRFLHVHPTPGLRPLPNSLFSAPTLPLGRLILKAVLTESFGRANRPPITTTTTTTTTLTASLPRDQGEDEDEDEGDEPVDSFFSRRFGDAFAHTLGSALVHGIYAADSG
jgi:protoporphyrinogen/coproporphyrinogen III oxidase